ncbi:MAG TPA: hypothetical protein VHI52_19165, partial [Verrucomicrobiae bacterium]|nr:hypothetical protein [Verrucomicrobiae bacterium]
MHRATYLEQARLIEWAMDGWKAHWVSYAFDPREDLGVFCLRLRLNLESVPDRLPIRISADQRYKLFVGDRLVCFGPQRGDLEHWFYETVDLSPFLQTGENTLWALVWNFGWMAPMAQISLRTAFLVDTGDSEFAERLNTPGEWEIARVGEWDFGPFDSHGREFYIEVGPGEIWRGGDWMSLPNRSDLGWRTPYKVRGAAPRGATFEPFWALIPRSIPLMLYRPQEARPAIRRGFSGDSQGKSQDLLVQTGPFS